MTASLRPLNKTLLYKPLESGSIIHKIITFLYLKVVKDLIYFNLLIIRYRLKNLVIMKMIIFPRFFFPFFVFSSQSKQGRKQGWKTPPGLVSCPHMVGLLIHLRYYVNRAPRLLTQVWPY